MSNPYVGQADIEDVLGRPLTDEEAARLTYTLDSIVLTIEGWLHRDIYRRVRTDERHRFYYMANRLVPFHWPVVEGTMQVKNGPSPDGSVVLDSVGNQGEPWEDFWFSQGDEVWIDYTSGDDENGELAPLYRAVIMDAALASVLSGVLVDSGALSSYSVEGTSIQFRDRFGDATAQGRVPETSLRSIEHLRRPMA